MTGRDVARAAARRGAPLLLRIGGRVRDFGPVFGTFERDSGRLVPLVTGYRSAVKSSWPASWWAVDALLRLGRRVSLPPGAAALAAEIENGRTLPLRVADVGAMLADLRSSFPDELLLTGRHDARLGIDELEIAPRMDELEAKAAAYFAVAAEILRTAGRHGTGPGARILDAGTGSGYLAFALAGLGAEVVGVDQEPENYVMPAERSALRAALALDSVDRVRLERADVHALPFDDASFDLVCGMTAVEHFTDLERAVAEMVRVLRPGGIVMHGVEPWFSRRGGHGLCTLDFPWGHVRLQPDEIERYVREVRPHEADDAIAYFRSGFQKPPTTLDESKAVFTRHLEVLEWREVEARASDVHRALSTASVFADCRATHPSITRRDLLTLTYTVVARRRSATHAPRRSRRRR